MARWSTVSRADRPVPVEMRFIDMFMAALAALLIMSMMFVYVISRLKHVPSQPENGNGIQDVALQVLTKSLPSARAEEPYSLAIAYRGGTGPIRWTIDGTLPLGMNFDSTTGVIAGVPSKPVVSRFVITAAGGARAAVADERVSVPLELTVAPPAPRSKDWVTWFLAAVLIVLLIWWARLVWARVKNARFVFALREMRRMGETKLRIPGGAGLEQHVDIEEGGIESLEEHFKQVARSSNRLLLLLILYSIGFGLYLAFWRG